MADLRGAPKCHADSSHSGVTAAEQLAIDAAKDAGWTMRWPRVRMMSQSPDLQQPDTQPSQQQSHAPQPAPKSPAPARQSTGSAWTQLHRFVDELLEVFGKPVAAGARQPSWSQADDAPHSADDVFALDATDAAAAAAGSKRHNSFVGNSSGPADTHAERHRATVSTVIDATGSEVSTQQQQQQRRTVVDFAREFPLLVLLLGWLALVLADWIITSAAIPRLLALLTRNPWSPFSESLVLQASLIISDISGHADSSFWGLVRHQLAAAELWLDAFVWQIQVFIASILIPLTRPYSMQWLAFSLLSVHALRRCTRLGVRATAVYMLYFAIADLCLWRVFDPATAPLPAFLRLDDTSRPYSMGLATYTEPAYECSSDACRACSARVTPPPSFLPLSQGASISGDPHCSSVDIADNSGKDDDHSDDDMDRPPWNVRSPFADAVEEALAQKRAMAQRHTDRMRRLDDWHQSQSQNQQQHSYTGPRSTGHRSSVLPILATLAVYVYAGYCFRKHDKATLRLCLLLFALDYGLRSGICAWSYCRKALGRRLWDSSYALVERFWHPLGASSSAGGQAMWLVNLLKDLAALAVNSVCFGFCVAENTVASNASKNPLDSFAFSSLSSSWASLLPIHVLSLFALLALREAAYCAHSMRVWYKAVVRDRRKGPRSMAARSAALSTQNITIISPGDFHDSLAMSAPDSAAEPSTKNSNQSDLSATPNGIHPSSGTGASSAYSYRLCFLCLSGYCERCLLSMEIWPTGMSTLSQPRDVLSSSRVATTLFNAESPNAGTFGTGERSCTCGAQASSSSSTSTLPSQSRVDSTHLASPNAVPAHASGASTLSSSASLPTLAARRKLRNSAAGSGLGGQQKQVIGKPILPRLSADSLFAESSNGLPSLRDSLLSLGLLNPQPPLAGSGSGSNNNNNNSTSLTQSASSSLTNRRGKHIDAWIISSVAHCPCRSVHGIGPSSFVPKSGKYAANVRSTALSSTASRKFEAPVGTLMPLAQYVRELKALGLVRPVDPASVVSNDDPTASVLPMIFGRFTVPENPRAVAAANALLASSAASYAQLAQPSGHVPGSAPFLGATEEGPTRILVKSTPLSLVRASTTGTFRLCVEDIRVNEASVMVSVAMTPILAHLLLTHPKTAGSAAVCVPAALAANSFGSAHARNQQNKHQHQPQTKQQVLESCVASSTEIDPFFDYTRVQILRTDIVLRVNGVRWTDYDLQTLNHPIIVRGIPLNQPCTVHLSVCGMHSEELHLCLADSLLDSTSLSQRQQLQIEAQELGNALEEYQLQTQTTNQLLKRTKRDIPKMLHHLRNDLEAARKSVEKQALEGPRLDRRRVQLEDSIALLNADIAGMNETLEQEKEGIEKIKSQLYKRYPQTNDAGGAYEAEGDGLRGPEKAAPSKAKPAAKKKHALTHPAGNNSAAMNIAGSNSVSNNGGTVAGFGILSTLSDSHTTSPVDSPRHSRQSSSSSTNQALEQLRKTEADLRRARSAHEEVIQDLKAERARWMAKLSQTTHGSVEPLEKAIEPIRRDLKEVAKRVAAGRQVETKLLGKLKQLKKEDDDAADAAGCSDTDEMIRKVADLREIIKAEQNKIKALMS
ncbi:hypothetical protein GGI07_001516 [Coemansia sp. Benny D115]|nr:hypothetical protein GGI07_001516 [Coemansia sp. Benny D115]